jgi:hypothetical protein
MQNLNALIQRLRDAGVEFVLVGGFASVTHGVSLITRDVDVCMKFSPENLTRLCQAVADLHPMHRMTPQKLPFFLTPELCRTLKNLYLQTDLGIIDCLGEVLGVGDFEAVKAGSIELTSPGGKWLVLDIPALIKAKEAMGRPHDNLTVIQLKAIQERQAGKKTI